MLSGPGTRPSRTTMRRCLPGRRLSALRRRTRRRPTTWEWSRPKLPSRLKFLGYVGSTVPRSGTRPSSKLGLKPRPTCGRQSTCTIPLPSGKMPLPTPRSGMLWKRSRLLALGLLWQQLLLRGQPRKASLLARLR